MSIPGFTASAYLDSRENGRSVLPALGPRENPYPKTTCLADCVDACRDKGGSTAQCRTRCQAKCSASDVPVSAPASGGLPIYGNYCGPGYGDDTGNKPTIDAVDAACKIHDDCYRTMGYFNCTCDRALLMTLPSAISRSPSAAGKAAGNAVGAYFSASACFCSSPICAWIPQLCVGRAGFGAIC